MSTCMATNTARFLAGTIDVKTRTHIKGQTLWCGLTFPPVHLCGGNVATFLLLRDIML